MTDFRLFQTERDDNFKFDENERQFSKRVDNSVGKGEIACYKQISPFPTVFSKDLYCKHVNPGLVWERVKSNKNCRKLSKRVENTVQTCKNQGLCGQG